MKFVGHIFFFFKVLYDRIPGQWLATISDLAIRANSSMFAGGLFFSGITHSTVGFEKKKRLASTQ